MAIRKVMEYLSGVIEADTKESTKMTWDMDSGSTSIHKGTPNTEASGSTISPMYRFFSNKKILERAPSSDILLLLNYPNY